MRRFAIVFACLFVLLLGGGAWWYFAPHLPTFVDRRQATFDDRRVTFLVVDLGKQEWQWELVNNPNAQNSVREWRSFLGADMVFNAAYFDNDGTPSGYLRAEESESDTLWPSENAQREKKSYSFLVTIATDALGMAYLPQTPQIEPVQYAFLSFPTLVVDGDPIVEEESYRYAARTVLAEDAAGHVFLIVTEKGSVSLFELAGWLAEQPEHFMLAGNLDGGPSTGLSLENGMFDLEVDSAPVPSVIAGFRASAL